MGFLKSTPDATRTERETHLVGLLVEEVKRVFNHGPSESWHQRDFEELAQAVGEASGQPISVTTLKRVMGRAQSQNLPGYFTLNQLAQFAGHTGLNVFEQLHSLAPSETVTAPITLGKGEQHGVEIRSTSQGRLKRYWFGLALLAGIALGCGLTLIYPHLLPAVPQPKGMLMSEPNPISAMPRQVKFVYKGMALPAGSVALISLGNALLHHFSTDSAGNGSFSYLYEKPGYYPVKVLIGKHEVASTPLLLPSNGWQLTSIVFGNELAVAPKINNDTLTLDGFAAAQTDTSVRFYTRLSRFQNFGISGDEFEVFASLRVQAPNRATADRITNIRFRGTNQSILIQMGMISPSKGFYVQTGEQVLAPASPLQSHFQQPLQRFNNYRMVAHGGRFMLYNADSLIFEQAYSESIGSLVGIEFLFAGNGQVANLKLRNRDQETLVRGDWGCNQ